MQGVRGLFCWADRTGKFVCSFALFISGQRSLACRSFILFRPARASHFLLLAQEKVTKEKGTPFIRPRLRRGSLAPSPFQGHAVKGHPWPITTLAASMPLNPFHGDSTRPPEGDLGVVCEIALQEQKPNAAEFYLLDISRACGPVSRPSHRQHTLVCDSVRYHPAFHQSAFSAKAKRRRRSFNCHIRFIQCSPGLLILGPVPSNTTPSC